MTEQETNWQDRLRHAVGDMAPMIAGALGGPLAGAAAQSLSRAILGREHASGKELMEAVLSASPETLLAVKKAELSFERLIAETQIAAAKISGEDRANARAREMAVRDLTPAVLGVSVIAGFFFVLTMMLLRRLPEGTETEFSIMLGALATMTAAVVNYYFGSSAGSWEKTKMLGGHVTR